MPTKQRTAYPRIYRKAECCIGWKTSHTPIVGRTAVEQYYELNDLIPAGHSFGEITQGDVDDGMEKEHLGKFYAYLSGRNPEYFCTEEEAAQYLIDDWCGDWGYSDWTTKADILGELATRELDAFLAYVTGSDYCTCERDGTDHTPTTDDFVAWCAEFDRSNETKALAACYDSLD